MIIQRRKHREANKRKRERHKEYAKEFVVLGDFPQLLTHNRKYGGTPVEITQSAKILPATLNQSCGHGSCTRFGFDRNLVRDWCMLIFSLDDR